MKHSLFLLGRVVALGVSVAAVGCGDDTTTDGTTSGGDGTCAPGASCPAVTSECIALVDNTGKDKFALRITQLTLSRPAALTNQVITQLLAQGVTLNLPNCLSESGHATLKGDGMFSWVLEFDKTSGMLRTGGASPEADPTQGYCFVNETIQTIPVAPFTVSAPIEGGKFAIEMGMDVTVPIFQPGGASTILLPLSKARIFNASISSDNNCIGKYNAEGLRPGNLCLPEDAAPRYIDGADLDGYVTLENADKVMVDALKQSLCVLLSADAATYGDGVAAGQHCKRDAMNNITFKGDWCSTTDSDATATCADAVKLGAKFAASAVSVKPSCP
jgi:hypothetical protein